MIDDVTIKAIENDINAIDPQGENRLLEQQKRRKQYHKEYSKIYRSKHKQSRVKYMPVIQSSSEHEPIEYIDL